LTTKPDTNATKFNRPYFNILGREHFKVKNIYTIILKKYWKIDLFLIKPTRRTNFPNLFCQKNSTCFGQFLCHSSGVFHCTFGTGICHAVLMTAFNHDQDGTGKPVSSWSSWQNKFGKLVRLLVLLKINLLRCTVTWT
jgi:hypothetical protein